MSTTTPQSLSPCMLEAAKITAAYSGLYTLSFLNILRCKLKYFNQAKAQGKKFDRYTSLEMRPADRIMGNFLEWYPAFAGPLWALAATGRLTDTCAMVAWSYVGIRALYFVMVTQQGLAPSGLQPSIWISTFPGYAMLLFLQMNALALLFV